jgi:phosphoglycolate phosphatase
LTQVVAVIFDLDGTLIDSAGDLQVAANRVLNRFGCAPLSPAEFRSMFGDGVGALIARALAARQCPVPDQEALRFFLDSRGLKLAVCTNKPIALTHVILERLALDRYFTHVVGGDSNPFRKPDPRVLLEMLAALQTSSAASVFVGDSEVDAATAAAAGVPFVLMTHGYHRGPVGEIPCIAALEHFERLAEFLAGGGRDA